MLKEDIGNEFIQSSTREKIYTQFGDKFGEYENFIAFIDFYLFRELVQILLEFIFRTHSLSEISI